MRESDSGANIVDLLTVSVGDTYRVHADGVDLSIEVRGSSLVSAGVAQAKAREVSAVSIRLQSIGVEPSDIEVAGVHVDVAAGAIIKTSEAAYVLKVHLRNLDQCSSVLTVVASQKQVKLRSVEWRYSHEDSLRDERLQQLVEAAKTKAARLSRALGVELIAVYRFVETYQDSEGPSHYADPARSYGRARDVDLGIDINRSKEIDMHLEIQYRISELVKSGQE